MSLSEFASVATNGKSVSFIYHGTRRIGEIVEAIILPNGGKPFGYITIDEKKDGFRRFSVRKMSEIELVQGENYESFRITTGGLSAITISRAS